MPLSTQGVQEVKNVLDKTVQDGFPGLVFSAVDKSGNVLVQHATGTLGIDNKTAMSSDDTVFWMASCTKLVTAVAVLQLVEHGKVPLDDTDFVKKILPEIKDKKVYADGVHGVDQEKDVTVRMLLSHTAGFGYSFIDPRLKTDHGGTEGQFGDKKDILNSRLLNQPGSMWEYGVNLDWAGIVVERLTGQTLGEYFAEHILSPLGITSEGVTMFPEQQARLAEMHQRDPDGKLKTREHLFAAQLKQTTKEQQDGYLQSGGAGLFSKPKEYVKILGAILNDGVDPREGGKRILKKESVDLLWENQIPDQPDFARAGLAPADPTLISQSPEMYPQPGKPPQGWSFGGFLTIAPGPSGRGANTMWWMGLANCFWWIDREKGVAGIFGAQVLPNGDPQVMPAWFASEKAIYDNLQ